MRIAFLTHRDAKDKKTWSGTLYYMAQSLKRYGDVIYLGPYEPKPIFFILKLFNKIVFLLIKKQYNYNHSLILAYVFAKYFDRKIKQVKPDVIIAAAASTEMCLLKTKTPIVYLSDITYKKIIDYYPNYSNFIKLSTTEGEKIEEFCLKKASINIYSSQWAADSAINDYHIPKDKVGLISYGANLDTIPPFEEAINKPYNQKCNILFLGVNWERKGGQITYETLVELNKRGFDAELTVCGCQPPVKHPKMIVYPYLDKHDKNDFDTLINILKTTNLMLVPTRADCTPIVFCEAMAFGIPVISTQTGGVGSVIFNGKNGMLLGIDDSFIEYANCIEEIYNEKNKYLELVKNTRESYEQQFNWNTWGDEMFKIISHLNNK